MSTEKKLRPIQPQPVRPFTLRLVNGHFVRIPKVEHVALTDATRPPSTLRAETSPHGDGTLIHRKLRLVNGRFVGGAENAPVQIPPGPDASAQSAVSVQPKPASRPSPSPDSWAYAFDTQVHPTDSPPET